MKVSERQLEEELINQLVDLKPVYRIAICVRASLVQDFLGDHEHIWHSSGGSDMPFASFMAITFDQPVRARAS